MPQRKRSHFPVHRPGSEDRESLAQWIGRSIALVLHVQLTAFTPVFGNPVQSFTGLAIKGNSQSEVAVGFLASFLSETGALAFAPTGQRSQDPVQFSSAAVQPSMNFGITPAKVKGGDLSGISLISSHDSETASL